MDSHTIVMQIPSYGIVIITALASILITILLQRLFPKMNKMDSCTNDDSSCNTKKCFRLAAKNSNCLITILVAIIVLLSTDLFIDQENAFNFFSFASTLTSIILSVLAIMMTIFSDAKNENAKLSIDRAVENLNHATATIQELNKLSAEQRTVFESILENSKETLNRTKNLEESVARVVPVETRVFEKHEFEQRKYENEEDGNQ